MYRQLFGFHKNPFGQPTGPQGLFLGRHHEEAIAHLTYAVMEGEGFTVLTGASGVGKTTVCRSFLDRLKKDVVAAYITAKNGLKPLQLLKSINAELGVRSDFGTIKYLTDALNAFLIQKKREGQRVALFIDDAQLLSAEVLEQVRLLSNLETTRDKLLQIVLIGRPELSEMLDAPSLRQIGQRVSVAYYINPLDCEETVAYVQHCISTSSAGPPVRFDQAAIRRVHKFTQGIPREINKACDRILTEACKGRERNVSVETARSALRKWQKGPEPAMKFFFNRDAMVLAGVGILILLIVAGAIYALSGAKSVRPTVAKETGSKSAAAPQHSQPPPETAGTEPAATTSPRQQARADATARKDAAPEDEGQFLAVLDSMRLQHNLDHVEATSAVGSEPSAPLSYSVQVGAFLLEVNARRRVEELKDGGYVPRVIAVTDPQGRIWYTVRIGDFPSLDLAQEKADEFTARENKASVVRPYNAF